MRRYVVLTLSFLFITVLFSPMVPVTDSTGIEMNDREVTIGYYRAQSYTPHVPMNITSNADFVTEGWTGSGTLENPYEIELLEISSDTMCIYIANTTAHFAIRNCSFTSNTHLTGDGIILRNVTNGEITYCEFQSLSDGVYLGDSHETSIADNIFRNCSSGFGAQLSSNIEIRRNTVYNGNGGGYFWRVTDSIISENEVYDMFWRGFSFSGFGNNTLIADNIFHNISLELQYEGAIQLMFAYNWRIESNTIYDCYIGILADWDTSNCTISSNNLTNNNVGIQSFLSEDIEISHNTIIGGFSGITVYECEDIRIDENEIDLTTYRGVVLQWSAHCKVTSNHILTGGLAIEGFSPSQYQHVVTNNLNEDGKRIGYFNGLVNTTISGTVYFQMFLVNCSRVIVENGMFSDSVTGVVFAFSDKCILKQSAIVENTFTGVEFVFTTDCEITDCGINYNGNLWGSGGINLLFTNNTRITKNMIYANNGTGIRFRGGMGSSYCIVYNNLITNQTLYGIDIQFDSSHNTIHGNAIGWNTEGNAVDYGSNNNWDDGESLGNFWHDYNGTDVYEIEGRANSVDHYPMQYETWTARLPIEDADFTSLGIILMSVGAVGVVVVIVIFILRRRNAV